MNPVQQRHGDDVRGADATPDARGESPPPRPRTRADEAVEAVWVAGAIGYIFGFVGGVMVASIATSWVWAWFLVGVSCLVGAFGVAGMAGIVVVSNLLIDQPTRPTQPPGDGGRPRAAQ